MLIVDGVGYIHTVPKLYEHKEQQRALRAEGFLYNPWNLLSTNTISSPHHHHRATSVAQHIPGVQHNLTTPLSSDHFRTAATMPGLRDLPEELVALVLEKFYDDLHLVHPMYRGSHAPLLPLLCVSRQFNRLVAPMMRRKVGLKDADQVESMLGMIARNPTIARDMRDLEVSWSNNDPDMRFSWSASDISNESDKALAKFQKLQHDGTTDSLGDMIRPTLDGEPGDATVVLLVLLLPKLQRLALRPMNTFGSFHTMLTRIATSPSVSINQGALANLRFVELEYGNNKHHDLVDMQFIFQLPRIRSVKLSHMTSEESKERKQALSLIEDTSQVKTLEFYQTEIDADLLTALVRLPLRLPQLRYVDSHASVTDALKAVRRSLTSLDLRPHELAQQAGDVGQVIGECSKLEDLVIGLSLLNSSPSGLGTDNRHPWSRAVRSLPASLRSLKLLAKDFDSDARDLAYDVLARAKAPDMSLSEVSIIISSTFLQQVQATAIINVKREYTAAGITFNVVNLWNGKVFPQGVYIAR